MLEPLFSKIFADKQREWVTGSIIAAVIVIHSPAHLLNTWLLDFPQTFSIAFFYTLITVRGLVFLLSTTILLCTLIRPIADFFTAHRSDISVKKIFQNSIAVFFISGILVVPIHLGIMGIGYGQMSKDPFDYYDTTNQFYQRLLMPALAYFLQFKGPVLFHLFSLLVTFLLIFLTLLFFDANKVRTTLLEKISLAGTSFIITQFQSPGYTEQCSLVFALIVLIIPMGMLPRIAAVSLALFSHEVSILLFMAIAWLYFSKEEKAWVGMVIVAYVSCWLVSFGFDLPKLFAVRTVGGLSGFDWLAGHPLRELGGLVMSYKLLWVVFGVALFRHSAELKRLLVFILPGIVATIFAVDTTRLMAFSFIAILFALVYVKKYALISERSLQFLVGLNLCLPSVYIGLNSGMVYFDGVYQLFYHGIFLR